MIDLLIGAVSSRALMSGARLDPSIAEEMVEYVLAGIAPSRSR